MLRLIVRQARPGMILARSIFNPRIPEQTLLAAGYTLRSADIVHLHEHGVYDLWINYPGLDFVDDLFSSQLTSHQQQLCETMKGSLHNQAQRTDMILPVKQYQHIIEELVQSIIASGGSLPFMPTLTAGDDALLRHSAEVCVLGLMLGLRLESYLVEQRKRVETRYARDVVNLGMGCMLHDIGELQLPETERESRRSSPLDDGEASSDWKKHVDHGYTIVRGQIEPSAAAVVLHHHQHYDGSGFPFLTSDGRPQAGAQIHVFARIAMAADTFQHFLCDGGVARPSVCALWQLQQPCVARWFDPVVLAALLGVVPPFVPGMLVTLSDRRQAIITHVHDSAPCYPEVQVLQGCDVMSRENMTDSRTELDLAAEPDLHIQSIDGHEVTPFLYGPRKPLAHEPSRQLATTSA